MNQHIVANHNPRLKKVKLNRKLLINKLMMNLMIYLLVVVGESLKLRI